MNNLGKIHTLFFCVLTFFAGVVVSSITSFELYFVLLVALLVIVITCVVDIYQLGIIAGVIFFICGFIRTEWWLSESSVGSLIEERIEILGFVSSEPDEREFNTRITVTLDNSHERVLLTVPHHPEYQYGDYLFITADLETPSAFETDQGRVFDYQKFLRKDKIYYTARYPDISIISRGKKGNPVTRSLLAFKKRLLNRIEQLLPEPHSSLLGGLLVGAKSSMGPELLDDFRETGVIHIVVLSGFNVTIIAEAIMRTLAFLGVFGSAFFGSISILLFTIMTGASATVVRAALMAFLVIIARVTGYQSEMSRALFVAAFFMVLHNPMILIYDPSFQLSFLATLGLIVLVPWIEKKLLFIPKTHFDFRGLAAASLGTQIFVLPMIVWMSGEVSLVSPLVNILVLWVVPLTMLIGFIMIIISLFGLKIALPLVLMSYLLLGYILTLVDIFAAVPFASIQIGALSVLGVLLCYCCYILIWFTKKDFLRNIYEKERANMDTR